MSRNDPVERLRVKQRQKEAREESNSRGTRGRKTHKGKATLSNKFRGGKFAR